ncbi:MAG: DUF3131 domain-containing protein [Clostridia bacterium]|nr:DUF3131 domain-containing protein [Clostridia bacterium]
MVQLVVLAISFLLIGTLLALALRRSKKLPPLPCVEPLSPDSMEKQLHTAMQALPWQRLAPLPRDLHIFTLLKRLIRCPENLASLVFLRENSRAFHLALFSLFAKRHARLPAPRGGSPRLLSLCRRYISLGGGMEPDRLLAFLSACHESGPLTLRERRSLPLCMSTALAEQLSVLLRHLLLYAGESAAGRRLVHRLIRVRRPMELLSSRHLTITATHSMIQHLQRRHEAALLSALEERMRQADYSLLRVAQEHAAHQAVLTDHLSRILEGLQVLRQLEWPTLAEPHDPLHQLFDQDPTGTYPAMDAASRAMYRQRAATLARLFSVEESRLAQEILTLCRAADPDGLADHVGWYLLEYPGVRALRRHLLVRRGALRLLIEQHRHWLHRLSLGLSALAGGLVFLHSGHPLWMLPFFLGVFSSLAHLLTGALYRRLFPSRPLPRMQVSRITEDSRTLIVLPVVLDDHAKAVQAVRRLLLARKAFPDGAVDCLLLADYAPCLTQTSSQDASILMAARMAVSSVDGDGGRFLYMHRRRGWDAILRAYAGPDGLSGAMECLNRLIVHGQCADVFDEATLPPAALHRRYACVLALDEDVTPSPDALHFMLGALSHPLNQRRHTAEGVRGASVIRPRFVKDSGTVTGRIGLWERRHAAFTCLYHPYSLLESTETWPLPHPLVTGALSGCAVEDSARFYISAHRSAAGWLSDIYQRQRRVWLLVPWLLSHVKSLSGVRRNPLSSHNKFLFRQHIRLSLLPVCALALLSYAVICRSLPLLVFVLLATTHPFNAPGRFLSRLFSLPLRAVIHCDALLDASWRVAFSQRRRPGWLPSFDQDPSALSVWETWSQGLAAIGFAVASLALGPIFLPGLLLSACFAVFPLLRPWLDAPLRPQFRPTPEMEQSLLEIARNTWQFFLENVTESTHHLPPEHLRLRPRPGASGHTSPAAIGSYLLSCLAMRELGLIDTEAMCLRVKNTLSSLEKLPHWHGLPFQRYTIEPLAAGTGYVSGADCGFLCACLIALAQGLRSYLPETPDLYAHLSGMADELARSMELHRLFDPASSLFFTGFHTETGEPASTHHELFASEALLLSYVAVMRRQVPFAHLNRLLKPLVRVGFRKAVISLHGSASEYLLPMLFFPSAPCTATDRTLRTVIRLQRRSGTEGMFGLSESGCWQLDPQLNYQRRVFGVTDIALSPSAAHSVISPYAAALCMPYAPEEACDSLARLRSRGMLTRLGFYESIDFDPAHLPEGPGEAVVQSHTSFHQGLLLCALCNTLTGHILSAHFTAVPQAASLLPMLQHQQAEGPSLPPHCLHPEHPTPREPSFRRTAQPLCAPVDAHIIGSPEATLLISAQGTGLMRSRGVNLTRFTGDPTQMEGIQFFLNDGLDTWRLTDPSLPGETVFSEGSARFVRVCGQIQTILTAVTDPVHGTFLHIVEAINLSPHHRTCDISSCLVPENSDTPAQVSRPEERVLTMTLHDPHTHQPLTLCHAVSTHESLLALTPQTDPNAFRTSPPRRACVSFSARLKLGPRGRAAVIFVTRLMERGEPFSMDALSPRLSEVSGMQALSALLSRTMTDALSLSQPRAAELTRLFGPLMWHAQPHQGAVSPLTLPGDALRDLGLEAELPLLLVIAHSDGCVSLLQDASDAAQWLQLLGLPVQLCVLCQGESAGLARSAAWELLRNRPATLLTAAELAEGLRETLEAAARVIFYEGSGTVTAQLEAMSLRLPSSPPPEDTPAEVLHPKEELLFPGNVGGFQPGTDDYVIHPDEAIPWHNLLLEGSFSSLCDQHGIGPTRLHNTIVTTGESVYLSDDRYTLAPLLPGQGLSQRITLSPGVTVWHSLGHELDMTLTAFSLSDTAAGCRTLRLKNTSGRERRFTLTITARFLMGTSATDEAFTCLTPISGGVTAASPEADFFGYLTLAEDSCESRAVSPLAFYGVCASPNLEAPTDETGTLALLQLPLSLPAGGDATVSWLTGACRHMDEMEQLLARLRTRGTSALCRQVRQSWSLRLGKLTVSTPDESLNLMMNRVLPWQIHTSPDSLWSAAALILTHAETAHALLTNHHDEPEDGTQLLLPYVTAQYILLTGDHTLLTGPVYTRCMQALTSIHLGQHGLPLSDGRESVPLALFFSIALQRFASCARTDDRIEIHTVRDRLLESLEQAAPVVENAWRKLLTSRRINADAPSLWMLSALWDLHQPDKAWALLQAMNPVLQDGFPLAGQPCAGYLYAAVLEKFLGFDKRGDQLRLRPQVPPEWDGFTITLQWGGATWRFHAGANEPLLTCDGESVSTGWITLVDDGRIHEVRTPLRQG